MKKKYYAPLLELQIVTVSSMLMSISILEADAGESWGYDPDGDN